MRKLHTPTLQSLIRRAARNGWVANLFSSGVTRREIAQTVGITYLTVCKVIADFNLPKRRADRTAADVAHGNKNLINHDRDNEIVTAFKSGMTLNGIGKQFGVTRERIRQILKKRFGLTAKDGGYSATCAAMREKASNLAEARCRVRYGCSIAERRLIPSAARVAFKGQQGSARSRGIEWKLVLSEWWQIWQQSGKWEQRGRGKGKYCMARVGDSGSYAAGNVYITTNEHNIREYHKGRDKTREKSIHPGVFRMYPGRPKSYVAKYNRVYLGCHATVEQAQAARASYIEALAA